MTLREDLACKYCPHSGKISPVEISWNSGYRFRQVLEKVPSSVVYLCKNGAFLLVAGDDDLFLNTLYEERSCYLALFCPLILKHIAK